MLSNVQETLLDEAGTRSRHLDEVRWPSDATPALLGIRVLLGPTNLSIRGLATQIAYMNREESGCQPLSAGVLEQVAATVRDPRTGVARVVFHRRSAARSEYGTRLAVGTLVGLAFKYLEDLLGPMSMVYHLPAAAAVAAPILICWLAGIWLLRKSQ